MKEAVKAKQGLNELTMKNTKLDDQVTHLNEHVSFINTTQTFSAVRIATQEIARSTGNQRFCHGIKGGWAVRKEVI